MILLGMEFPHATNQTNHAVIRVLFCKKDTTHFQVHADVNCVYVPTRMIMHSIERMIEQNISCSLCLQQEKKPCKHGSIFSKNKQQPQTHQSIPSPTKLKLVAPQFCVKRKRRETNSIFKSNHLLFFIPNV